MTYIPKVRHLIGGGSFYSGNPGMVSVNFDPSDPDNEDYLKNLPDGTLIIQYGVQGEDCTVDCETVLWIKQCSTCDTPSLGLVKGSTQSISANGAITLGNSDTVLITKTGTLAALTLAAPTDAQFGRELTIVSTTAFAHTVTQTTPGFNNAGASADVATFATTLGSSFTVKAMKTSGGTNFWGVLNLNGVTLA